MFTCLICKEWSSRKIRRRKREIAEEEQILARVVEKRIELWNARVRVTKRQRLDAKYWNRDEYSSQSLLDTALYRVVNTVTTDRVVKQLLEHNVDYPGEEQFVLKRKIAYRLPLESGLCWHSKSKSKRLPSRSTVRIMKSKQGIFWSSHLEVEKRREVDSRSSSRSRFRSSSRKDYCQTIHFTANIHREVDRSFASWIIEPNFLS